MLQTVRSRISFSLFANLTKSILTFLTGMLIARGLGPEEYGRMVFLLSSFMAFRQLLDSGSSTAFFTFLSQRERSLRFVCIYFTWLLFQFFLTSAVIWLLLPNSWIELVWAGELRSVVILAFVATFTQSTLWSVMVQIGESQRLTHWVQSMALSVTLTHFLLMMLFWWGGWLEIKYIFILLIIEWGFAVAVIAKHLRFAPTQADDDTLKSVFSEFWRYCFPLIPYGFISFVYEFIDRWLLQTYAGSIQQAEFAVASQFSVVIGIATTSILNIFWKEIAEAHHKNNFELVSLLYKRATRILFFAAATMAGMLGPWAEEVLELTLGPAYIGGAIALTIMFYYPIHQSIGQIGGVMAFATGRVSSYVLINMCFMGISIIITYFLLAPSDALFPGLALGSLGLAGKMVLIQVIGVNVVALYICRSLRISFEWTFQIVLVLACTGFGLISRKTSIFLFQAVDQLYLKFMFSSILYAVLLGGFILIFPNLIGSNMRSFNNYFSRFKTYIFK